MSYKVYETLKYFAGNDGQRIKINTNKVNFDLLFNKHSVPHLLGLQYMYRQEKIKNRYFKIDENNNVIKASDMYRKVIEEETTDEEIYEKIRENNPSNLNAVKNRIESFTDFMKNLEKGYVVENVKVDNLGGKVNYFVVEDDKGNYNHLGIKTENGVDIIENYNENTSKLITYLVQKDNRYFQGTRIKEDITKIEVYDREKECYIPFSFDKEKNEKLLEEYRRNISREEDTGLSL